MKPRLHLLGLPHTQTTDEFSHCAFTGKVKKFSPMMRSVGYEVIHYGVEGADSGANVDINVVSEDEWNSIRDRLLKELHPDKPTHDKSKFIGDLANVGNELYTVFNDRLKYFLRKNVENNDIICLPFGFAHRSAVDDLSYGVKVETGIGYPDSYERFRIFESHAWHHYELGRASTSGNDYWWTIPNYFISDDWQLNTTPSRYVAYFGRIDQIKGLDIVYEIARHRPDLTFILCGQGDPAPYLTLPNVIYNPPIHGKARSDFLGNALAVLMPTRYVEPFGGVTVEAQLCGTPVLGSTWGSFTETIEHGISGFRCHTLGDYLAALELIEEGKIDRPLIRQRAVAKYDYKNVAHQYDAVFTQLSHISSNSGWYTIESPQKIHKVSRAVDYNVTSEKREWAERHLKYWKENINGVDETKQTASLFMANLLGILDEDLSSSSIVEVGAGPYSVLGNTNAELKLIVDPAYYGVEIDAKYVEQKIEYVPQTYETFSYKTDIALFINTISSFESYRDVIEHSGNMASKIYISELLDENMYDEFLHFITKYCEANSKKIEIISDKKFNNKKLFVCKIQGE